jgi:hypothetical protein
LRERRVAAEQHVFPSGHHDTARWRARGTLAPRPARVDCPGRMTMNSGSPMFANETTSGSDRHVPAEATPPLYAMFMPSLRSPVVPPHAHQLAFGGRAVPWLATLGCRRSQFHPQGDRSQSAERRAERGRSTQ